MDQGDHRYAFLTEEKSNEHTKKIYDTLRSLLFSKAAPKSIELCNYYFRFLKRNKTFLICKENEPFESIYLLVNGSVTVSLLLN